MITGVIDATLYGLKSFSSCNFSALVKFCPVVDLTDMKTFPYCGIELVSPVPSSKLPSSPPKTATACVFANNLRTKTL